MKSFDFSAVTLKDSMRKHSLDETMDVYLHIPDDSIQPPNDRKDVQSKSMFAKRKS